MNMMPMELPTDAVCAERLRPMLREADIPPAWPMATQTVVELLRSGGGFDVDEAMLDNCARTGQVGRIIDRDGRIQWTPQNVGLAAAIANASRRWIPGDPRHIGKLSGLEVLEQQAIEAGGTIFTDVETVDIRSLVGLLIGAVDNELRAALALGLAAKLRKLGVIE